MREEDFCHGQKDLSQSMQLCILRAEARRSRYIEFIIDSNLINKEKLTKQLFIGSEGFIEPSTFSYHG